MCFVSDFFNPEKIERMQPSRRWVSLFLIIVLFWW